MPVSKILFWLLPIHQAARWRQHIHYTVGGYSIRPPVQRRKAIGGKCGQPNFSGRYWIRTSDLCGVNEL